jgi:hypothetical protein
MAIDYKIKIAAAENRVKQSDIVRLLSDISHTGKNSVLPQYTDKR